MIPSQFWYAYKLDNEFDDSDANPITFIDGKIDDLLDYSFYVQTLQVDSDSEVEVFEESITEVMYRIEGISHFTLENFYTFDYLNDNADLTDDSMTELNTEWYTTISGYNTVLREQLNLNDAKLV